MEKEAVIGNYFLSGSISGNGLTCGTTTTPLYPGRASLHAGGQSSQSLRDVVFVFFYSANMYKLATFETAVFVLSLEVVEGSHASIDIG